jgi:hypothetical protein
VVSEESSVPYDRTKLSKALVDDETKLQWRTAEELKNDFKVDYKSSTVSSVPDSSILLFVLLSFMGSRARIMEA